MKTTKKRILSALMSFAVMSTLVPAIQVNAADSTKVNATVTSVNDSETVQRKVVAYFPEWAYQREANDYYTADRMPWDKITHINYAFAHVGEDNKITIGDKVAALEAELPGQTDDFPYKGHFNVLNSYKKKYPNVKTVMSVGGWAESSGFYKMCATEEGRQTFAASCVDFLRTYGFDGIDIDYEYPTSVKEAGNPIDFEYADQHRDTLYQDYLKMMETLRNAIDEAKVADGKDYLLTAAVTASGWVLAGMGRGEYLQYLDYVNLMTYDYHGSWDGYVAHNSPLYSDPDDPATKPINYNYLSVDWSVKYFSGLIDPSKIVVGIPYYTRGWENVQAGTRPGGLYGSAWAGKKDDSEGTGATGEANIWYDLLPDGTEEPGGSNPLWHVKNLINDKTKDYVRYWDDVSKVPYVWNATTKTFLSFEDEQSMGEKMDYIVKNNLGGAMIWEIDGDFSQDSTGKYVIGDTLTTIADEKLKAAGPITVNKETRPSETLNFDMDIEESFDHPNNEYKIVLNNNTGSAIKAPWTLEFDIPNSVYMKDLPWGDGGTITKKVVGNMIHFTMKSGDGYGQNLSTGKNTLAQGEMILKVASAPQNMKLNGVASKAEWDRKDALTNKITPAAVITSTNHSENGNYNVQVKVAANSNGKTVDLYENGTKIKSETIGSSAKTFTYNMSGKQSGSYVYKAVITGDNGQKSSINHEVYVGSTINVKAPTVSTSTSKSLDGSYSVMVDVPANSNGKILEVYENGKKIQSEEVTNSAKTYTYAITGKTTGTNTYSAVLKNAIFTSEESNKVAVKVLIVDNYPEWTENGNYSQGSTVIYKGNVYQVKDGVWWIPAGNAPDSETGKNYWTFVRKAVLDNSTIEIADIASRYNLYKGEAGYDEDCDLNKDGQIELSDLVLVAQNL